MDSHITHRVEALETMLRAQSGAIADIIAAVRTTNESLNLLAAVVGSMTHPRDN